MEGPLAQQFAQVRETLDAEYDGFCAWCQASVHEQPHASECEGRHALAALSAIERHVQDMEKALDILWTKYLLPITDEEKSIVLAALPASGTRNRVAREKGEE